MYWYRRAAAVVLFAGLVVGTAGCPSPATPKQPSITFFGSNFGAITTGNPVQLQWQTREVEKIEIYSTDLTDPNATPKLLKTIDKSGGCTDVLVAGSTCLDDGYLTETPTADTEYSLHALRGQGRCDVRDVGGFKYPEECDIIDPVDISVLPPASATLDIGGQPSTTVSAGADVTVNYAFTDAAAWDIGVYDATSGSLTPCVPASAATATDPCTIADDGQGNVPDSGTVTVPNVQASMTLSLDATNGADDGNGDIAPGAVSVQINLSTAPTVDTFTASDTTVLTGDTVTLSWTTTNAASITTTVSPAADADVTGCQTIDASGAGTCDVVVTADATGGNVPVTFSITATDSSGNTSAASTAVVTVGLAPATTLAAAPADLTMAGGDVALTWTTPTATSVMIVDDATTPNTVVDTANSIPAACDSGSACDPTGDTFTVTGVVANTTWTITATNDYGSATATATATLHNPAAISAVTFDDGTGAVDALGATPVTSTASTGTLAWTATDAMDGTLMSAPASAAGTAGDCTTVPAGQWTAVTGFTFSTGTFGVTGLTADTCYQLTANSYAGQADAVQTFLLLRKVDFVTVTANGSDVTSGAYTIGSNTNPPVLAWTTASAGSYSLYSVPKTGPCASATYPAVPDATGSTGNGTFTPAVAVAAETCYEITIVHPTDATRTATFYLDVTP